MEEMVKAFHEKYGHLIRYKPEVPASNVRVLRYSLIKEEVVDELLPAMADENLTEIADGIADAIYVLIGTAISFGIPIERVFTEVHRSNMTKTAIKAEDGKKYGTKTPKGPDYIAPDVHGILYHPEVKTYLETHFDSRA